MVNVSLTEDEISTLALATLNRMEVCGTQMGFATDAGDPVEAAHWESEERKAAGLHHTMCVLVREGEAS